MKTTVILSIRPCTPSDMTSKVKVSITKTLKYINLYIYRNSKFSVLTYVRNGYTRGERNIGSGWCIVLKNDAGDTRVSGNKP